jgi:transposase
MGKRRDRRATFNAAAAPRGSLPAEHPARPVIIRHDLVTGRPYDELGADFFTRRMDSDQETRRLIAKLEALGHTVSLQPAA